MRKISAIFLVLVLVLSLGMSAAAYERAPQMIYSPEANSGTRHEVCTDLSGTSAWEYYTGDYNYDDLAALDSDVLLQTLRTLMTETHTYKSTYNDCRDLAVKTDCENEDGTNISLIYSGYIATWGDWINNSSGGWNREHVWPKSLGGFGNNGAGSDLHHVRPSDSSINSKRDNEKFGEVTGGSNVTGTSVTQNALGGTKGGGYFEPLDDMKGDIARICLYVYVRYGGELSQCNSITNVFQSVDVLLQWCASDPVDTWEMGRNEVVYAIQGNRNVFIDYPELAWLLFDREIPEDILTPTNNPTQGCPHLNPELRNETAAACGSDGYSGDLYCLDCGEMMESGAVVPATGEHTYGEWITIQEPTESEAGSKERSCTICSHKQTEELPKIEVPACSHTNVETRDASEPTCGADGSTGDTYCLSCGELVTAGTVLPATGEHTFGEWSGNTDGGEQFRDCTVCGYRETQYVCPGPGPEPNWPAIGVAAAAVIVIAGGVTAIVIIKKKKA